MNLRRKRLRLMRDTQWRGYLRTSTGNPITLSQVRSVANLSVLGNSAQDDVPSPDNPVPVLGSGERTVNLFNAIDFAAQDGVITNSDGSFTLPKKSSFQYDIEVRENTEYTLSVICNTEIYQEALFLVFLDKNKQQVSQKYMTSSHYVLNNQNIKYIRISGAWTNQYTITFKDFMIVQGTYSSDNMPEYEPYGYKVAVTASGRNLCDNNIKVTYPTDIQVIQEDDNFKRFILNREGAFTYVNYPCLLKPNTKYTVFTDYKVNSTSTSSDDEYNINDKMMLRVLQVADGTDVSNRLCIYDIQYSDITIDDVKRVSISFATRDISDCRVRYSFSHVTARKFDISVRDPMVVEGTYTAEMLPLYEPYKEPRTFNVYTPEPLHGVGDAHDTVLLDFDKHRATLISNIVRYVIGDNWGLGSSGKNIVTQRFYQSCEGTLINNARIISNTFEEIYPSSIEIVNADEEGANVSNTRYLQIKINKSRLNTVDVAGFKEWISNYESINRELQFYGEAYNPTTTDITALQDWDTMPQLTGTWILTASGGTEPTLTAEYYSNERSIE